MAYSRIRKLLTRSESRLLRGLTTPHKIQDFLDSLPINFEVGGETYMSPRRVLKERKAHCFEGALLAALAFAYHGKPPLLMDFRTTPKDEDHVVAVFRSNRMWGAISKTNHAVLRFRDPVFRTPRELAMSYFHDYFETDGRRSLRAFSGPFDLSRLAPERWVTASDDLFWLVEALDACRHFPVAPKRNLRRLRRAAPVELRAMRMVEWTKPRGGADR